jgi:hypothetical protein
LRPRSSGWSSSVLQDGSSSTLSVNGVRVQQGLELLAATAQDGAVEEAGAETMTTTIRRHHTTIRVDRARAHTAQISLRAGDLGCGLAHWVGPRLGTQLDAWPTEATRRTADGAATAVDGTITEKEAQGHPLGPARVSRTPDTRALVLARPRGGRQQLQCL